jgi:hypothetical protein
LRCTSTEAKVLAAMRSGVGGACGVWARRMTGSRKVMLKGVSEARVSDGEKMESVSREG